MRGVHPTELVIDQQKYGSSPHARGPLANRARQDGLVRIIPACAGSTYDLLQFNLLLKDHPRMRGVHPLSRLSYSRI